MVAQHVQLLGDCCHHQCTPKCDHPHSGGNLFRVLMEARAKRLPSRSAHNGWPSKLLIILQGASDSHPLAVQHGGGGTAQRLC